MQYTVKIQYRYDIGLTAALHSLLPSVARTVFEAVETDRVGRIVGVECRVIDIIECRFGNYDIIYRGLSSPAEYLPVNRNLLHRHLDIRHIAAAHYPRHRIFGVIGVNPFGYMAAGTVAAPLNAI